MYRQADQVFIN